jgi:CheY-like chemotaxis protein
MRIEMSHARGENYPAAIWMRPRFCFHNLIGRRWPQRAGDRREANQLSSISAGPSPFSCGEAHFRRLTFPYMRVGRDHVSRIRRSALRLSEHLVVGPRTTKINRMKISLIEDDEGTASYVEKGLRQAGHVVDRTGDGREGLVLATTHGYDAAVIERMLPGLDGLGMIKTLRDGGVSTPVLLLSSLSWIDDRVESLEAGADDYLSKPFAFFEFMARLKALGRRSPITALPTANDSATPASWRLNPRHRTSGR